MYVVTDTVAIATNSSGVATVYSKNLTGRVLELRLVVPGTGGLAATSDITITNETTGAAILTLTDQNGSCTHTPTVAASDAVGTAVTAYTTKFLANQRVKVAVAQGGDTLAATLYVTVG